MTCECDSLKSLKIESFDLFEKIKKYFETLVKEGVFFERMTQNKEYDLTVRVFECKKCGCVYEFIYPDFPMIGRINKFRSVKNFHSEIVTLKNSN